MRLLLKLSTTPISSVPEGRPAAPQIIMGEGRNSLFAIEQLSGRRQDRHGGRLNPTSTELLKLLARRTEEILADIDHQRPRTFGEPHNPHSSLVADNKRLPAQAPES